MFSTGIALVFASILGAAPPRGVEIGLQGAYANFPIEDNFWTTPLSHAFPYGAELMFHDGQGMAYGLHAVRGPARLRWSCFNAPSCDAFWWQTGVNLRRTGQRGQWQWFGDLDVHYAEGVRRVESSYPGEFSVTSFGGVGVGAGGGLQYRWARTSVGPFLKVNLESTDTLIVGLAGIRLTYFLELPSPAAMEPAKRLENTEPAPAPVTAHETRRSPWSVEARATVGAWGWREPAHLRVGYLYSDNVAVGFGGGWGIDHWLCELEDSDPTGCRSQRIRAVVETRFEVLRSTYLSLGAGLNYRWAESREPAPRPAGRTLEVVRDEFLLEVSPGFYRHIYRGPTWAIGLGVEPALLSSNTGGFANKTYFFGPSGFVFEPRAHISVTTP